MPEPIFRPDFWQARLDDAETHWRQRHRAVYNCGQGTWLRINRRHAEILARLIRPTDSILDAGCAWGRLLDLLPDAWHGGYVGVDLSPTFIDLARSLHPNRCFVCGDLRRLPREAYQRQYDWAVLISVRQMIVENAPDAWPGIERGLRRATDKILILEYDPDDEGLVLT